MNRMQNYLLSLLGLGSLLFVAFNWSLVWQEVTISFLFIDIPLQPYVWLVAVGFGVAAVNRWLAAAELRTQRRRAEQEIQRVKAEAMDAHIREVDTIAEKVQQRLQENLLLLARAPADPAPGADDAPATPKESRE